MVLTNFAAIVPDESDFEVKLRVHICSILDEIIVRDLKGYEGIHKYVTRECYALIPSFAFFMRAWHTKPALERRRPSIRKSDKDYSNFLVQFKNSLAFNRFNQPMSGSIAITWLKTIHALEAEAKFKGDTSGSKALKRIDKDIKKIVKSVFEQEALTLSF